MDGEALQPGPTNYTRWTFSIVLSGVLGPLNCFIKGVAEVISPYLYLLIDGLRKAGDAPGHKIVIAVCVFVVVIVFIPSRCSCCCCCRCRC